MDKVSVIIASRKEALLAKTVDDIFNKARGNFEVIVICDEGIQELTPRPNLKVVAKIGKPGMKSALNQAIALAEGKYLLKTDAHCMFGEGFDTILVENHFEDNWIVIPRRYSLDAEKWATKPHRRVIDYEYFTFPFAEVTSVRVGGKWFERGEQRKELLIDETMQFQGSCWFMTKEHYNRIGGLEIYATKDEFILEPEELAFKTWLSGGKVMVNKKTWYAHYHKSTGHRGYFIDKKPMKKQRIFHIDYWMHDKWPKATRKMEWFIERFSPIPGWPQDWKDPKYEQDYLRRLEANKDPNKIMV